MWRLIDLGPVDGYTMTNLYEAVGRAVSEEASGNTVIFNHPESPFVNIGYHQIAEKEIDIKYAREKGFDIVRRSLGGGAILDGAWEQDYFIIVHRRSHDCPTSIPEFYRKFLRPSIYALKEYGLNAQLRPPNDITVDGRKISGNGAITIDKSNVLAGDILLQAPIELMTKIIKTPNEKFRDKLAESMAEWLTSLERETGVPPDREEIKAYLGEGFEKELDISMEPGELTQLEMRYLEELIRERRNNEWIFGKDLEYLNLVSPDGVKTTKVREGVAVHEAVHKAKKLIRVTLVSLDERIHRISISGDFFTQPYVGPISRIEEALKGETLNRKTVKENIEQILKKEDVKIFGATPEDLATAILKAAGSTE